jgi:hypothetical protein
MSGNAGEIVSADVTFTWDGDVVPNQTEHVRLFDVIEVDYFGRQANVVLKDRWEVPELAIRCDNFAITGSSGCAFDDFTPTYTLKSAHYPAAAALYWTAVEGLNSHPGSRNAKRPLHRVWEDRRAADNRAWICENKSGDPNGFDAHPDSSKGPIVADERPQCDEYAFAASQESAGSDREPVTGNPRQPTQGIRCAQFYATKKTSRWVLRQDTRKGPLPTRNEPCVRGAIPGDQNGKAGGGVGGIVIKYRLMYGDPYYVEVPGFEGCSITAATCEPNFNY